MVEVTPELALTPRVRGRPFAAGNAGRKLGSKNRVTVIASSLLEPPEPDQCLFIITHDDPRIRPSNEGTTPL